MLKKLFGLGGAEPPVNAAKAPAYPTVEEVLSLEQRVDELAKELPPEKGILWATPTSPTP
jgi:hypothetical protein